jgi:hypothetical protein
VDDGGEFWDVPEYLTKKVLAHHRPTSEPRDDGGASSFRSGAAALYRCQAPDPECDCSGCRRERRFTPHPKAAPQGYGWNVSGAARGSQMLWRPR